MFISIVEIDLPPDTDRAALKDGFNQTAPRYTEVPGLLRKYYTVGAEDQSTGGVSFGTASSTPRRATRTRTGGSSSRTSTARSLA